MEVEVIGGVFKFRESLLCQSRREILAEGKSQDGRSEGGRGKSVEVSWNISLSA